MGLDVLLEILWAFEGLATEFAFVRLEWDVDSDVRGDVVTLHSCGAATSPLTGQVQVVGRFTADMALADMFLTVQSILVRVLEEECKPLKLT